MSEVKKNYVPALTGLRFFAALIVFFHHLQKFLDYRDPFFLFFKEGYLGVTIFFTLSGYLITRNYQKSMADGKIKFGEYWLRRFARIFPVYLVAYFLEEYFYGEPLSLANVAANLTFTKGLLQNYIWTGLGNGWSLTVEECFYLIAPLAFFAMGRKVTFVRGLGVTLLAVVGLKYLGQRLAQVGVPGAINTENIYYYSIFSRFAEFGIGILAAVWMGSRKVKKHKKIQPTLEFSFVASLLGIVGSFFYFFHLRDSEFSSFGITTSQGVPSLVLMSAATAAFILSAAHGSRIAALVFGNRVSNYLGKISYAFYIIQGGHIAHAVFDAVQKLTGQTVLNPWLLLVVFVGIAAALYELVEKPAHRYLLAKISRAPQKKRARYSDRFAEPSLKKVA